MNVLDIRLLFDRLQRDIVDELSPGQSLGGVWSFYSNLIEEVNFEVALTVLTISFTQLS